LEALFFKFKKIKKRLKIEPKKLVFVDIFHQLNSTIKYMTRVILDVPSDKMKPLMKAVTNLGIDHHSIRIREIKRRHHQNRGTLFTLHKIKNRCL
jgi:hypothetical protein